MNQKFVVEFYASTDCRAREEVEAPCYITALAIVTSRRNDYATWPLNAGFSIKIKVKTYPNTKHAGIDFGP